MFIAVRINKMKPKNDDIAAMATENPFSEY